MLTGRWIAVCLAASGVLFGGVRPVAADPPLDSVTTTTVTAVTTDAATTTDTTAATADATVTDTSPAPQATTASPATTTPVPKATTTSSGSPAAEPQPRVAKSSSFTAPSATTAVARSLSASGDCPLGGAVGLLLPNGAAQLIGTAGDAGAGAGLVYPADGSILSAAQVNVSLSRCGAGGDSPERVELSSVSLLGGALTARSVELSVGADGRLSSTIEGLQIDGRPAQTSAGRVPLGNWGYVEIPPPSLGAGGTGRQVRVFAIHLLKPQGQLPAGTVLLAPALWLPLPQPAAVPQPAVTTVPLRSKPKRHGRLPLKVTPPLGAVKYTFPVAGRADFGDSYGGLRTDVAGHWHHGDDIFAALGTPVVAVADGTLNRVGWERVGGWRLWVRDRLGNEFYYAHLAGYTPLALHSKQVKRGEVIGFVGNTGDAFPFTQAHLHFEVHPRSLLQLHYDGAVDPTTYLEGWPHLQHVKAPAPVHPRFPRGKNARQETTLVFRKLLAARGATASPVASVMPIPELLSPAELPAAAVSGSRSATGATTRPTPLEDVLLGMILVGSVLAVIQVRRRRAASTSD